VRPRRLPVLLRRAEGGARRGAKTSDEALLGCTECCVGPFPIERLLPLVAVEREAESAGAAGEKLVAFALPL
jgi:hypothetical protein